MGNQKHVLVKTRNFIHRSSYQYVVSCIFLKLLPLFFKVIAHIEGTNSTLQLPIVELFRTVTFIGQQYNTFIISSNNTPYCQKACIIFQYEISVEEDDMYPVSCYVVFYV